MAFGAVYFVFVFRCISLIVIVVVCCILHAASSLGVVFCLVAHLFCCLLVMHIDSVVYVLCSRSLVGRCFRCVPCRACVSGWFNFSSLMSDLTLLSVECWLVLLCMCWFWLPACSFLYVVFFRCLLLAIGLLLAGSVVRLRLCALLSAGLWLRSFLCSLISSCVVNANTLASIIPHHFELDE